MVPYWCSNVGAQISLIIARMYELIYGLHTSSRCMYMNVRPYDQSMPSQYVSIRDPVGMYVKDIWNSSLPLVSRDEIEICGYGKRLISFHKCCFHDNSNLLENKFCSHPNSTKLVPTFAHVRILATLRWPIDHRNLPLTQPQHSCLYRQSHASDKLYIPKVIHDDVIKWKHFPLHWPFAGN